jgi:hypothetical protein
MKAIVKPIGRFFKNGFKTTGLSVEKRMYDYEGQPHIGYVVYQNSVIFWLPSKNKIVVCSSFEELKEINFRCELGLKLEK